MTASQKEGTAVKTSVVFTVILSTRESFLYAQYNPSGTAISSSIISVVKVRRRLTGILVWIRDQASIRYGYYRYQANILLVTVILLIALVQIFQFIGTVISVRLDKRHI